MRTLAILTIYVSTFLLLSSGQALSQYQLQDAFPNLPSFSSPVEMAPANDGSDRIFIVDQGGHIYVFDDSSSVSTAKVFLDLSDVVSQSGGETGLLGLAFHPNYSNNGYFYVDFSLVGTDAIDRVAFSSERGKTRIRRSRAAGWIFWTEFYRCTTAACSLSGLTGICSRWGDGGPEGHPLGNGQNKTILLGKILRINVDSASSGNNYSIPRTNPFFGNTFGYREEIYAYGLRNPWKISFGSGHRHAVGRRCRPGYMGRDRHQAASGVRLVVSMRLGVDRCLIGTVDTERGLEISGPRLLVQTFDVALFGATLSGVSMNTSKNSPSGNMPRTISRSALNGEMKAVITTSPASVISLATSPTRRIFSMRSASVKPRSLLRPWRTLWASRRIGSAATATKNQERPRWRSGDVAAAVETTSGEIAALVVAAWWWWRW